MCVGERKVLFATMAMMLAALALAPCTLAQNPATPTSVKADSDNSRGMRVAAAATGLQVDVTSQTPLSVVLAAVCKQQQVRCNGTETLAGYAVPAMSVDGTLRQVVSRLVEGTDVNYSFSHNETGTTSTISFLGHAPRGVNIAPAPAVVADETREQAPPPLHSRLPNSALAAMNRAVQQAQFEGTAPERSASEIEQTNRTMNEMFSATPTTDVTLPEYLPFPDANGNPVPASNSQPAGLPFPDKNGNAMPSAAAGKPGSPFPNTQTQPQSPANAPR